jgi:hypothetical protein
MDHTSSTFLSGCASTRGFIFFAKELDELAQDDSPNSSFFRFRQSDAQAPYRKYAESVGWPAISMATIKPAEGRTVVAIGPNGDYWECHTLSVKETVGTIKGFKGNLRALSVLDEVIYACGMDRVVWRREGTGRWKSIGPKAQKDDPPIVGFEDLAGYDEDEMYAVGWGGEIWWRDRGQWRRVDSPASVNLRALVCAEDEKVYIVGRDGTMLSGRHDAWSVIDTGRAENLMDVAFWGGTVYVTTDFRILKLVEGKLVNDENFAAADRPATCLYLLQAEDGLVSLGTKDMFVRNGGPWTRIP